MRFSLFLAVVLFMFLWSGCGGNSSTSTGSSTAEFGIIPGNWDIIMLTLSNPNPGSGRAGGNLTQTGSTISGTLHMAGSRCFDPLDDLLVTGQASARSISITTAPVQGQTVTFTSADFPPVLPIPNSVVVGSYTISGGACAAGEKGSFAASLVPSLTGTWKGSLLGLFNGDVTGTLSQTGPDPHGFYHLSGVFTFTGSPCFTSGTIANSQLFGGTMNAAIDTNDGEQTLLNATFDTPPPRLDSIFSIQSGACSTDTGAATLIKQ
jgi:hypothetical protein